MERCPGAPLCRTYWARRGRQNRGEEGEFDEDDEHEYEEKGGTVHGELPVQK